MQKILRTLGLVFLIVLMLGGAAGHVVTPEFYAGLVPSFIPLAFANWASFVVELAIGIMLIVPRSRKWGGLAFSGLMVAFLPLHVWDMTKDVPMVGSHVVAGVRIGIQLLLIWGGWRVYQLADGQQPIPSP